MTIDFDAASIIAQALAGPTASTEPAAAPAEPTRRQLFSRRQLFTRPAGTAVCAERRGLFGTDPR